MLSSMATFYVPDNHKDELIKEKLPQFKKLKREDHKVRVPLHCITNGNDESAPNPVCTSYKEFSNDCSNRNFDIECVTLLEHSAKLSTPEEPTIPTAEDRTILKDYGQDILEHLFNQEKSVRWPNPNYMRKQQHLTHDMRSILIQWLIDVSIEYHLVEETVFLAVNYIDRFLNVMSVVREKFQLVGAAAIMVSVKVEDVVKILPEDWSMLTAKAYTTRQIIRMEKLIMSVLNFDLRPPTVICFIRHICAKYHFTKDNILLSMYIAELTLLDGNKYMEYLPSKLAVSAIVLVRYMLNESDPYFKNLQFCCGYSCEEIKPVMVQMCCTLREASGDKFQSIQRKYGHKVSEFFATINWNNMNFFG